MAGSIDTQPLLSPQSRDPSPSAGTTSTDMATAPLHYQLQVGPSSEAESRHPEAYALMESIVRNGVGKRASWSTGKQARREEEAPSQEEEEEEEQERGERDVEEALTVKKTSLWKRMSLVSSVNGKGKGKERFSATESTTRLLEESEREEEVGSQEEEEEENEEEDEEEAAGIARNDSLGLPLILSGRGTLLPPDPSLENLLQNSVEEGQDAEVEVPTHGNGEAEVGSTPGDSSESQDPGAVESGPNTPSPLSQKAECAYEKALRRLGTDPMFEQIVSPHYAEHFVVPQCPETVVGCAHESPASRLPTWQAPEELAMQDEAARQQLKYLGALPDPREPRGLLPCHKPTQQFVFRTLTWSGWRSPLGDCLARQHPYEVSRFAYFFWLPADELMHVETREDLRPFARGLRTASIVFDVFLDIVWHDICRIRRETAPRVEARARLMRSYRRWEESFPGYRGPSRSRSGSPISEFEEREEEEGEKELVWEKKVQVKGAKRHSLPGRVRDLRASTAHFFSELDGLRKIGDRKSLNLSGLFPAAARKADQSKTELATPQRKKKRYSLGNLSTADPERRKKRLSGLSAIFTRGAQDQAAARAEGGVAPVERRRKRLSNLSTLLLPGKGKTFSHSTIGGPDADNPAGEGISGDPRKKKRLSNLSGFFQISPGGWAGGDRSGSASSSSEDGEPTPESRRRKLEQMLKRRSVPFW